MIVPPRGFTLIEVLIAAVVLAIVMAAILGVFNAGMDACNVGSAMLAVQTMNTSSMAEMTERLRESRVISVAGDGHSITFQVPVRQRPDGAVLDATNNVIWGADDRPNWSYTYAYAATRTFGERVEGPKGTDLNRDGDRTDTFALGCLVEEIRDESGALVESRQITPSYIAMSTPTFGGDIDNDGVADALFSRVNGEGRTDPDGPNIRISFFSFKAAGKQRSVLLHPSSVVTTRNS